MHVLRKSLATRTLVAWSCSLALAGCQKTSLDSARVVSPVTSEPVRGSAIAWEELRDTSRAISIRVVEMRALKPLIGLSVHLAAVSGHGVVDAGRGKDDTISIVAPDTGLFLLTVRAIGYESAKTSIRVRPGFRMSVVAVMAPLTARLESGVGRPFGSSPWPH